MKVSLIVAVSENGVIGKDNDLIWSLPKDTKFFKDTTKGHHVITGRKNFESIPHKFRPLPNRTNIIVTRKSDYKAEGCIIVHSLEAALKISEQNKDPEPFIIGGGQIYKLALDKNLVDRVYLTKIHEKFEGDTFFPKLNSDWEIIKQEDCYIDVNHKFNYSFIILEKK